MSLWPVEMPQTHDRRSSEPIDPADVKLPYGICLLRRTSSIFRVPAPPAFGAVRSPTPRISFLTALTWTPFGAELKVLSGMSTRSQRPVVQPVLRHTVQLKQIMNLLHGLVHDEVV